MKTSQALQFAYSYEEFSEHIKAMKTVREWEYTLRFGHLGNAQTTRANSARALEYFSDCYTDTREAVYKAGVFLSIYDYIGRYETVFARKNLIDKVEERQFAVDNALLRAVHYVFTTVAQAASTDPRKIIALARALGSLDSAAP